MGFLRAALMFFNLLAWPLFSRVFPLYASVRAIETNSMQEMRALVAYWILFSLISIFELAFGKLIQRLPFWPYIKLITICWLVLPWFNGASYVYEHLIHRWLSVNPKELANLIVKPKKSTSLEAERFLSMAEKYVEENGCEALEKLIAGKPEHRNPDVDMEEIKAVKNTEEKGTAAAMLKVHNAVRGNAKAVELTAKNSDAATERSPPRVPNGAKENAKAGELEEKDLAATERMEATNGRHGDDNKGDGRRARRRRRQRQRQQRGIEGIETTMGMGLEAMIVVEEIDEGFVTTTEATEGWYNGGDGDGAGGDRYHGRDGGGNGDGYGNGGHKQRQRQRRRVKIKVATMTKGTDRDDDREKAKG